MIKLDIYDRTGVLETYKLEYLPDIDRFYTTDDVVEYINEMNVPEWRKLAFKNRLWAIVDWCHPKEFYRIYVSE